jgi:hypothetical protein
LVPVAVAVVEIVGEAVFVVEIVGVAVFVDELDSVGEGVWLGVDDLWGAAAGRGRWRNGGRRRLGRWVRGV